MERLQKIISQAGLASRRAAEELIRQGRVSVNGKTVTELGTKADIATDDIRVDARRLKGPERLRYVLLYKPKGYITTRADEKRRRTVMDLIDVREYVYPVGRLDYDSEGLLLLPNDGDLAARLTPPSHGVERVYEALVAGVPTEEQIERLRTGIPLDGKRTEPADVAMVYPEPLRARAADEALVRITIREGRNRQVRRMFEAIGHPVGRLRRVRIGPISDKLLKPGYWRDLTPEEVRKLKVASEKKAPPGPKRPKAHEPRRSEAALQRGHARKKADRAAAAPATPASPAVPRAPKPASRPERPPVRAGADAKPRPPRPPAGGARRELHPARGHQRRGR